MSYRRTQPHSTGCWRASDARAPVDLIPSSTRKPFADEASELYDAMGESALRFGVTGYHPNTQDLTVHGFRLSLCIYLLEPHGYSHCKQ